MKCQVTRASNYSALRDPKFPGAYHADDHHNWYVDVNSIEELNEKLSSIDKPIIFYPAHYYGSQVQPYPEIMVYDAYIE